MSDSMKAAERLGKNYREILFVAMTIKYSSTGVL
jgi:hypothetical protein